MTQKRNRKVGNTLIILTLLAFGIVIGRLSWLYVAEGVIDPVYRDPKAVSEYYRGSIYDRNGNILAMDSVVYMIDIEKVGLPGISRTASLIEPWSNLTALEIENLLSDPSTGTLTIPSNMGREKTGDFLSLMEKENLGSYVTVRRETERVYPLGVQGADVIGKLENGQGTYGAEKIFNEMLLPPMVMTTGIVKGSDITLALDSDIEYLTYINSISTKTEGGSALSAVLSKDKGELLGLTVYGAITEEDAKSMMSEALSGNRISLVPRTDKIVIENLADRTVRISEMDCDMVFLDGFIMITASPETGKADRMMDNLLRMMRSRGLVSSDS